MTAVSAAPASADVISLSDERASIRRRLLQRFARDVAERAFTRAEDYDEDGAYPAADVSALHDGAPIPWQVGICDDCLTDCVMRRFSEVKHQRVAQLAHDMYSVLIGASYRSTDGGYRQPAPAPHKVSWRQPIDALAIGAGQKRDRFQLQPRRPGGLACVLGARMGRSSTLPGRR
jgi:hypothetical protein